MLCTASAQSAVIAAVTLVSVIDRGLPSNMCDDTIYMRLFVCIIVLESFLGMHLTGVVSPISKNVEAIIVCVSMSN